MDTIFLKIFLFSFLIISGFVAPSFSQLMISDLSNAIVELRLVPEQIELNSSSHKIGYVNLINKNGFLVKPYTDVTITLSSDNSQIATVPESVTINANENYAVFNVETKNKEGITTISANYNGQTVYQNLIVGELNLELPDDVELIIHIPAEEMHVASEMPFSVFLQNEDKEIIQAPYDITVNFDFEDSLINLDHNEITIPKGSYYGWGVISTHEKVGNSFLRAFQDELNLQSAVNIRISSSFPAGLEIDVFPKILPNQVERDLEIVVSLIDSEGFPTLAQEDTKLEFFSSSEYVGREIDKSMDDTLYSGIIKKGEFSYHFKQNLSLLYDGPVIEVGVSTPGLGIASDCFAIKEPVTDDNPSAGNRTLTVFTLDKIPSNSQTIAVYQMAAIIEDYEFDDGQNEQGGSIEIEETECLDLSFLEDKENVAGMEVKLENYVPILSNENIGSSAINNKINLVSSDRLLLSISEIGKINSGDSFGSAVINSGKEVGSVELSTTIKGFGSSTTTTEIINTLKHEKTIIFSPTGPENILFDKNGNFDLFLISLDSRSRPTFVENEARYLLNPVNQLVEITKDSTYSHANFHSNAFGTAAEEKVTIKAVPIGVSADQSLTANANFEKKPSSEIKIILPFDELDKGSDLPYAGIAQIIDFRGNPVPTSEDLKVKLESTNSNIADIPRFAVIPSGKSYVEFPIEISGKIGSTTIIANANGIIGSEETLSVTSFLTKMSISSGTIDAPITPGVPQEVKLYVDSENLEPLPGIELTIQPGVNVTVTPTQIITQEDGSAKVHVTASNGRQATFEVFATSDGFIEEQKIFSFDVDSTQIMEEEMKVLGLPEWVVYVGIAAMIVIGGVLALFFKKPKKDLEEEEEIFEDEDI